MAVIDARRGEVFAAGWAAADVARADAAPLLSPRALAPEALAEAMRSDGRAWLAVGDGAVEFREALERAGARIPEPDSELQPGQRRRALPAGSGLCGLSLRRASSRSICVCRTPRSASAPPGSHDYQTASRSGLSAIPTFPRSSPSSAARSRRRGRWRCSCSSCPSRRACAWPPSMTTDTLLGYLICARYDTVWHLMNIAVEPALRRRGIARALLEQMIERAGRRPRVHAGGADLQRAGDRPLRAVRVPLGGHAASLLPRQRRGRGDHVAHRWRRPPRRARRGDPRARDLLRRHLRGGRHRRWRRSSPTSSPPRASTTATAASSRRSPAATTWSWSARRCRTRCTRPAPSWPTSSWWPSRAGRASSPRCSSGWRRPRRWPPPTSCRWRAVDHLHGHIAAGFLEPSPLEPPFLSLIASGGHTFLARVDRPRPRLRGARPDARRRRRRGVRQGRAAAGARLSRRRGAGAAGARRRPGGLRLSRPARGCRGWTSPSPG